MITTHIPFKNAKILIVSLLVSGSVISVIPVWPFCLLKEKQATMLLPLMLVYSTNVLIVLNCLLWLEFWLKLFPPIHRGWVHPLYMSPSFWILTHCTVTLQPNHWTLVLGLLLLVTGVGNQNQSQPSATNSGHSSCCCVTDWPTKLPHTCCISGFISLCKCLWGSVFALGKMETVTSSLSFIS